MKIQALVDSIEIKVREKINPFMGYFRRKKIQGHYPFTIISNNCWGGHVYRYFNLPYDSPTIGLYFFSDDYIKFLSNLRKYISTPLVIVSLDESKYRNQLKQIGGKNVTCPIGRLDDIEIIFLHYATPEEALEKWNRRCKRIHWNNLYIKMSEQNICSIHNLRDFDSLPFKNKVVLTTRDYGLASQVISRRYYMCNSILDDTTHFRSFINLEKWISDSNI